MSNQLSFTERIKNNYYSLLVNDETVLKNTSPIFQEILHLFLTLNEPKCEFREVSNIVKVGMVQIIIPESGYNFLRDFSITNFCGLTCRYCFGEFLKCKEINNHVYFMSIDKTQFDEYILNGEFYIQNI